MNLRLGLTCMAVVLLGLSTAAPAAAQDEFPGLVKEHLTLGYAPPCSVCHAKGNTGSGTVVTPFGWSMRGRGLEADDPKSVGIALDALKNAKTDSDGDHVSDVDELVAGTDPNVAGSVPLPNGEQTGYGCGGSAPDPNRRGEGSFAPLAVAMIFCLRRMMRRGGAR